MKNIREMLRIHTIPKEQIWQKAADLLIARVKSYSSSSKKVLILLSGGSSVHLYPIIAKDINSHPNYWKKITFAQADERFRPQDQNEINANAISKTNLPEVLQNHRIPIHIISQKGSLKNSTTLYNQTLSKLFSDCEIKLAALGVGENCHTAGLLPGYQNKWNVTNYVAGYVNAGKFRKRITVTPKAIAEINYAVVTVTGEQKRNALEDMLKKSHRLHIDHLPAVVNHTISRVDLVTDIDLSPVFGQEH